MKASSLDSALTHCIQILPANFQSMLSSDIIRDVMDVSVDQDFLTRVRCEEGRGTVSLSDKSLTETTPPGTDKSLLDSKRSFSTVSGPFTYPRLLSS